MLVKFMSAFAVLLKFNHNSGDIKIHIARVNCECSYHRLLTLFPGLLCFYLPFAFTVIHESRFTKRWKAVKACLPGLIHGVSEHEVDVGGEGPIIKHVFTKLESEFLTYQDKKF